MCIRAREDCNPSRARALRAGCVPKGAGRNRPMSQKGPGENWDIPRSRDEARRDRPRRIACAPTTGMMRGCGGNGYAVVPQPG